MKKVFLITLISLSCLCLNAQTNLDSLNTVWQDETQPDSVRTTAYQEYIWDGFLFSNPDTAFDLAQTLLNYGEQHKYPESKVLAYNTMGISNAIKSDYPKSLDYFQRSLKISEEIGNKSGIASSLGNIGNTYYAQGAYIKALDYYQRGLKFDEEIGNKQGMALKSNNIGNIYYRQGDYVKALEYFQRSLKINEEIGDKRGIALYIGNIGGVYNEQGDYVKALDYYQRSLKIYEEIGNKSGIASSLGNIGNIYYRQGDYVKALEYFQRSLKNNEEIGDKRGIALYIGNIGGVYNEQGDYVKALEYYQRSLKISQEIGSLADEKSAYKGLYEAHKAMGNGNEALVYLEKMQVINDSLNAEETSKKLQQMEFSKQVLADSIETAEETRLVEEAHQEEVRQKNKTRNYLAGGGLLALLLAGGFYSRWRYVRRSRDIISKEKDRSNNLLLNILPADIAEELKIHGKAEARDFDMVSILFTDFKGFTEASAKLNVADLVNEINACFEAFDGICGKYEVEKIKTIGDAYMAAGGLPVPTDGSVKNTVLAALEMQDFISDRKAKLDSEGKPAFEMRVGIHTGPVVAGIVGVKKFQYDIWGDTVNTANRMESSGDVGKVNISQSTYELLKDDPDLAFESRGKIEAKGKGEIEMWFVSQI